MNWHHLAIAYLAGLLTPPLALAAIWLLAGWLDKPRDPDPIHWRSISGDSWSRRKE